MAFERRDEIARGRLRVGRRMLPHVGTRELFPRRIEERDAALAEARKRIERDDARVRADERAVARKAAAIARPCPIEPGARAQDFGRRRRCAGRGDGGAAGTGERPQVAGEIAAVHRRHVGWSERREGAGVVPVEQMAVVRAQRLDRGERRLDAPQHVARADEAELTGDAAAEHVEADVRRRRPVGDDQVRIELDVVRRQVVVARADVTLEDSATCRVPPRGGRRGRCCSPRVRRHRRAAGSRAMPTRPILRARRRARSPRAWWSMASAISSAAIPAPAIIAMLCWRTK